MSSTGFTSIDCKLGRFVYDASGWLQSRAVALDLHMNMSFCHCCPLSFLNSLCKLLVDSHWANLLREDVIACRKNVGHKGAVLDIFIITNDMDSVVARLGGPVENITRSITFVVAFDLSLRWALDGKTCMHTDVTMKEMLFFIYFLIQEVFIKEDLPKVPTSVPMASTTKSADLPTMPVSRPGPHALTF